MGSRPVIPSLYIYLYAEDITVILYFYFFIFLSFTPVLLLSAYLVFIEDSKTATVWLTVYVMLQHHD